MIDPAAITGIVALTSSFVALGGFILSASKARADSKKGISDIEQVERRDTIADRDSLVNQFQETIQEERSERKEQAARLAQRIEQLEQALFVERHYANVLHEYAQDLRHRIYKGEPPPPPPMPTRISIT